MHKCSLLAMGSYFSRRPCSREAPEPTCPEFLASRQLSERRPAPASEEGWPPWEIQMLIAAVEDARACRDGMFRPESSHRFAIEKPHEPALPASRGTSNRSAGVHLNSGGEASPFH